MKTEFEKRVELFKRLIERGSILASADYPEETQARVLAFSTLNLSDDVLSMMVLESYFLYKPEIRKRDICHNANSKNCAKCHEPECNLAKGWMKADNNEKCEKCGYKFDDEEFDNRACQNCGAKRK